MADTSDRIALPIRVHEFLLACAGRIDDDALTDARELLAVAELDRAVELLAGSLVAGRIPLSADERDELRDLVDAVRAAPSLVDRIIVVDQPVMPRHRFTVGAIDDPAPDAGVVDAVGRVIEVLPDIRALSCVWRTTPAGAVAGPVPQRVVLVETGPDGFAPSTAYRVEQVLRRAGIRAAVEVVEVGTDLPDYHANALAVARRISLRQAANWSAETAKEGETAGSLFADPAPPRPVTTTRRRPGAHAEKRPPDTELAMPQPEHTPEPVAPQLDRAEPEPVPARPEPPRPEPARPEPVRAEPVRSETVRPEPVRAEVNDTASGRWQQRIASAEPPVLEPPLGVVESVEPLPPMEPVGPLVPAEPVGHAAPSASLSQPGPDADLSNRERELLRQLHEELAKREHAEPVEPDTMDRPAGPDRPERTNWQVDRSGQRHDAFRGQAGGAGRDFGSSSWRRSADQTAVNGIPPYGGGSHPPAS